MLVQGMRAIWHPWFAIASVTQDDHASGILGHLGVQYPCHRASWAIEPWFTRVWAITVWLEVQVFQAPPRSLTQTEIPRPVANSPELAGIRLRISLCRLSIGFRGPFRRLFLCLAKSRFPTVETSIGGDSVRIECYRLVLPVLAGGRWCSRCCTKEE